MPPAYPAVLALDGLRFSSVVANSLVKISYFDVIGIVAIPGTPNAVRIVNPHLIDSRGKMRNTFFVTLPLSAIRHVSSFLYPLITVVRV